MGSHGTPWLSPTSSVASHYPIPPVSTPQRKHLERRDIPPKRSLLGVTLIYPFDTYEAYGTHPHNRAMGFSASKQYRARDSIRQYNGGMLQRLLVARALIHDPKILFLNEPTMGLDPQARRAIWEKVKKLNQEGKTILLTTHYMEEADALCDRITIMNKGEIVERGSPKELKNKGPRENVIKIGLEEIPPKLVDRIKEVETVSDVRVIEGSKLMELHIFSKKGKELSPEIVSCIKDNGMDVLSMDVREPTLEDIFINLTGERLESTTPT